MVSGLAPAWSWAHLRKPWTPRRPMIFRSGEQLRVFPIDLRQRRAFHAQR